MMTSYRLSSRRGASVRLNVANRHGCAPTRGWVRERRRNACLVHLQDAVKRALDSSVGDAIEVVATQTVVVDDTQDAADVVAVAPRSSRSRRRRLPQPDERGVDGERLRGGLAPS